MRQYGEAGSAYRHVGTVLPNNRALICGTHCVSKLCLIHMLLLQQLCATLLDQVCGVQVHFALLFKAYYFLFQLAAPGGAEDVVYNHVSLLLQTLANSWGYGRLKAFQGYSAFSIWFITELPYLATFFASPTLLGLTCVSQVPSASMLHAKTFWTYCLLAQRFSTCLVR